MRYPAGTLVRTYTPAALRHWAEQVLEEVQRLGGKDLEKSYINLHVDGTKQLNLILHLPDQHELTATILLRDGSKVKFQLARLVRGPVETNLCVVFERLEDVVDLVDIEDAAERLSKLIRLH